MTNAGKIRKRAHSSTPAPASAQDELLKEAKEALGQCVERLERCENYKYGIDDQLPMLAAAIEYAKSNIANIESSLSATGGASDAG